MNLTARLPKMAQIYPVFGLITLLVYGWGFCVFFWILPTWIKFLTLFEIASILSYELVVNFLESVTLLAVLTVLAALLPQRYFRDHFVFRGSIGALSTVVFFVILLLEDVSPGNLVAYILVGVASGLALQYLLGRIRIFRSAIETLADRAIIFLYLLLPLTMLAFIVILIRNIWW